MRRIRRPLGQLTLNLPVVETPRVPSVTLHKQGRNVLIKANDTIAADILEEVRGRQFVSGMRNTLFFGSGSGRSFEEKSRIKIYEYLEAGIESHPLVDIYKSYGLEVHVSPTLKNYMAREHRRQQIEQTPFPLPPITSDISLFERSCEGLMLRCIKNFTPPGSQGVLFRKDARYLVVSTGGDGRDVISISTHPITSHAVLDLVGNGARHEWTAFDEPMETYFDDSESTELEADMLQLYPEKVRLMETKLKAMQLPLYEHVEVDAAMMALKRGILNGYPMRMAKTSCAIAVAELAESKKVGVFSPGNARLFWSKEFVRLGFKKNEDFIEVRKFKDLEHPAKYKLLTFNWMRQRTDKTRDLRNSYKNLLKPSERTVRQKVEGKAELQDVVLHMTNDCPHCNQPMERYVFSQPLQCYRWTRERGYMCRNKDCFWTTDNHRADNGKRKTGAAWYVADPKRGVVEHKGGYIDTELAMHVRSCPDERVKGRQCSTCGATDGEWIPPRYRRFNKKFTHVILDEAHACKDPSISDTAKASLTLRARRRQALSGTFISNSPIDIYYPLYWALNGPSPQFPYFRQEGLRQFDERFCDAIHLERAVGKETDAEGNETDIIKRVRKRVPFLKNPPDFWRFIAPKLRRRSYQDPLFQKTLLANGRSMPRVDVNKVPIPMDGFQAALLLSSITEFKVAFQAMQAEAELKGQLLNMAKVQNMSQMITMRTLATCPERLNDKFPGIYQGPPGGGKMRHIKRIVDEKVKSGGKVVILSDFIAMQKSCAEALKEYGVIRFNTDWDDVERDAAFSAFQNDQEMKVFIAGTRAVRESVDLSAADTTICTDLLWSPAFQMQAWSRTMAPATRDRVCEVYIMLSKDTIDEHIYNVFYSKMVAAEQALDRKVLNRRAAEIDVKWFVDRIVEAEKAISVYIRDGGYDTIRLEKLDLTFYEGRG